MGQTRSPETSERNKPTLRNIPEDDRIQKWNTTALYSIMYSKQTKNSMK
jgi:hypothetical protein